MAILTIGVLKKLIENMPDEYTVEYDKEETIAPIEDKMEIDVSGKRVILNSYFSMFLFPFCNTNWIYFYYDLSKY